MKSFRDLESLRRFLQRDAGEMSLNPARFINVDSLSMWRKVKALLLSFADETVALSKFCEDSDTTPNLRRVADHLKKARVSQLVYPLSEYLRIVPDRAESEISGFLKNEYRNNGGGKLRIYFLMYRMKSLLETIRTDDPRAENCVILLRTDEQSDYRLTIVQKDLDVRPDGQKTDGLRSYLRYWESNPEESLVLQTRNAVHFAKNSFFDNVTVIASSYDLLRYRYNLPQSAAESLGREEDWSRLAEIAAREGGFEEACRACFTARGYSESLLENWDTRGPFEQWLLWLWTRQQTSPVYVAAAAKACDSPRDFVNELYCGIFSCRERRDFDALAEERRHLLSLTRTVPTESFLNALGKLPKLEALACLTSLTETERKRIFDILADFDFRRRGDVLTILKKVYPRLYYYLTDEKLPSDAGLSREQKQYFCEYKWLKATNTITEEFVSRVRVIAEERGARVFCMQPRNYYVSQNYDGRTAILFVDGLGMEYAGYLAYVLSDFPESEYNVRYEAGYCELPSVTEKNTDFMNGRNIAQPPIHQLDELKHGRHTHPESLMEQFNILDSLKGRVLAALTGDIRRVIITGDHGTSRMAVKARGEAFDHVYPKPENAAVYRYGRYCEDAVNEADYPTAILMNGFLVFADYSRFSQSGAPDDEIHGGASLEEWLVPVITVERLEKGGEARAATPASGRIRPEPGSKQVTVAFTVSGEIRGAVTARVQGQTYRCGFSGGVYSFSFTPAKTGGKIQVRIADDSPLGEFSVEIEQGIRQNSDFDI